MILLIDNYDSFSYNLVQLVGELAGDIKVIRNDELTIAEIEALKPSKIILSPGPGRPEDAGVTMEVASVLGQNIPILGVCLGHQAISAAYGATVTYAKKLMHGKQSMVRLDKICPLFRGLPDVIPVARYHSLATDATTITDCLKVVAEVDGEENGDVMAIMHTEYPIYGLQFHPESILTPDGRKIIKNFIEL